VGEKMGAVIEIRYAKQGDLHIAYRVTGEGPVDVVMVPNWVTDVEHTREGSPSTSEPESPRWRGSGIEFEDRGTHKLKGVPDEWRIFSVVG
jgi:hypothetical protein